MQSQGKYLCKNISVRSFKIKFSLRNRCTVSVHAGEIYFDFFFSRDQECWRLLHLWTFVQHGGVYLMAKRKKKCSPFGGDGFADNYPFVTMFWPSFVVRIFFPTCGERRGEEGGKNGEKSIFITHQIQMSRANS